MKERIIKVEVSFSTMVRWGTFDIGVRAFNFKLAFFRQAWDATFSSSSYTVPTFQAYCIVKFQLNFKLIFEMSQIVKDGWIRAIVIVEEFSVDSYLIVIRINRVVVRGT